MKCRYLGTYIAELNFDKEGDPEYTYRHLETDDRYNQDLFMRSNGIFDGVMTETNTSAIGLKVIDEEIVKLWRIY